MKTKRFIILILVIAAILCTPLIVSDEYFNISALSRQGSIGDEVVQVQTRLKELGYYDGEADGIFGSKTKKAVELFQRDNGLAVDGIVGEKTLSALGIVKERSNAEFTEAEISLLAKFISAEARGESYEGQVAVGAVILNRVEHPSFPNTIAGVLYQPGAFECLANGQVNEKTSEQSIKAAYDAINGWDPSGGAIYYYNPSKVSNKFMLSRTVLTIIGDHTFCS